jgi:hypothetical protein
VEYKRGSESQKARISLFTQDIGASSAALKEYNAMVSLVVSNLTSARARLIGSREAIIDMIYNTACCWVYAFPEPLSPIFRVEYYLVSGWTVKCPRATEPEQVRPKAYQT